MLRCSGRQLTSAIASEYDYVVIGGGVAGCSIASHLATDGQRTLLLERGDNVMKRPQWHSHMPAASLAHRAAGRYIRKMPIKTPDLKLDEGCTSVVMKATEMEIPEVLGGANVSLGGKAYVRGHVSDWGNDGICGRKWSEMMPYFKALECVGGMEKHRGQSGRFMISEAEFVSPIHKPVLEALQKEGVPLVAAFNGVDLIRKGGMGRAESFVDSFTKRSCGTLTHHLEMALRLKRPLTVASNSVCQSIQFSDDGEAHHVTVSDETGERNVKVSGGVVLSAGAVGSAEVLLRSPTAPRSSKSLVGHNFWAQPSLTVQYGLSQEWSLRGLAYKHIQILAGLDWRLNQHGWAVSTFDDMSAFICSDPVNVGYPDVRVDVQPFLTSPGGSVIDEEGFQFVINLLRPESRGAIRMTTEGVVADPGVLSAAADRHAFVRVAEMLHRAVQSMKPTKSDGIRRTSFLSVAGPVGGTCSIGDVVDTESLRLIGSKNVTVCDGSVIRQGHVASSLPTMTALAEMVGLSLIGKKKTHDAHPYAATVERELKRQ